MVQRSRDTIITRAVLLRVLLFVSILVIGFYEGRLFLSFLTDKLNYKEVCSGFCFLEGFGAGLLALTLSYSFWFGVIFGAVGKKADYIVIGVFFILALVMFYGLSFQIYLGLIGVALLGNAIGYILKIGRENWFGKK